jgi:hypothetical protein
VRVDLDPEVFVPAPAQGALALEVRRGDPLADRLTDLHDVEGYPPVAAERGLMAQLQAGCQLALAAHAWRDGVSLSMVAWFEGREARVRHPHPEGLALLLRGARSRAERLVRRRRRSAVRIASPTPAAASRRSRRRCELAVTRCAHAPVIARRRCSTGDAARGRALVGLPWRCYPSRLAVEAWSALGLPFDDGARLAAVGAAPRPPSTPAGAARVLTPGAAAVAAGLASAVLAAGVAGGGGPGPGRRARPELERLRRRRRAAAPGGRLRR